MQQLLKVQDQSDGPPGSTSIAKTRLECLSSGRDYGDLHPSIRCRF